MVATVASSRHNGGPAGNFDSVQVTARPCYFPDSRGGPRRRSLIPASRSSGSSLISGNHGVPDLRRHEDSLTSSGCQRAPSRANHHTTTQAVEGDILAHGGIPAMTAVLAVTDEVALPIRAVGDLAAAAEVSREEVAVITQFARLGFN